MTQENVNKSLQDSYIYNYLNNGNRINNDVTEVIAKGTRLSKDNMEQAFLTISKRFDYSLKNKVLEAVDKGEVLMYYAPEGVKLPSAIPFFLLKGNSGNIRAIVLIDNHGSMSKETKEVTIDPKKLYVTLEAAYIALKQQAHVNSFSTRVPLLLSGATMFANMITRCLNRKYALNVDKNKLHKVQFIAAKYFIMNIALYNNEALADEYASQVCVGANQLILKDLKSSVYAEDLKDVQGLINTLSRKDLNIAINDLTVRGFLEMYINMYHHSALLSLELLPYFIYTINSAVHGAYINNQKSLEDIVDRIGAKFYVAVASAAN